MIDLLYRPVPRLALVLLMLQVADLVTTGVALHLGAQETNPLVLFVGWYGAIITKFALVIVIAALAMLASKPFIRLLTATCALYTVVVVSNLLVIAKLA